MLVYEYFENDNNKFLMDLQFEMYSYSISTIFEEIKRIYLENSYAILYLSKEEIELIRLTHCFDHRLLQGAHDILAAVFRFRYKEGFFEIELFENDNSQIKSSFSHRYIDTDFLNNIPDNYWHLAEKWHRFLVGVLKENVPLVHELILATLVYILNSETEMAFAAAHRAIKTVKEEYTEIPWIIISNDVKKPSLSTEEETQKGRIIKYDLYNYSEECKIGYGGTSYHRGCIVFHGTFFSIEDFVTDKDDYGDSWHGNHTKYVISSEKYPELVDILSREYHLMKFEQETGSIRNIILSLDTILEKIIFRFIISIIQKHKDLMTGGKLARLLCGDKITYTINTSQYDDFYPESDTLNYDKTEIINGVQ